MFFSKTTAAMVAGCLVRGIAAQDELMQFSSELPIPQVKQPKYSIQNPLTNQAIDYYEIDIKSFSKVVAPNTDATEFWGYDGVTPGPMFIVEKGTETVVRFINSVSDDLSIHLHGSYSRAVYDGWAEDVIAPGSYKDYYYPNTQSARFSWYHDHAMDHTANNVNRGLAGGYIIHDPEEDSLGLPRGYGVYDIPLLMSTKGYNTDGTLIDPVGGSTANRAFGFDLNHVNGQAYPFLAVEPRKYRFRLLNGAPAKHFTVQLQVEGSTEALPFQIISADSGLLSAPINATAVDVAMGERWDIVVDFSPWAGQNITVRDDSRAPGTLVARDNVMQFQISSSAVSDDSTVPAVLREVPFFESLEEATARATDSSYRFAFNGTSARFEINGVAFSDVNNRVLARPTLGETQIWELVNGGGAHPVHLHLVDFRIIERTGSTRGVLPQEAVALKDMAWIAAGETVRLEAHFAPYPGLYMFHCHNLVHEDNEMMAAFNVTHLEELGYEGDEFFDPMEEKWRAVPVVAADFTEAAIIAKVQGIAALQPYAAQASKKRRFAPRGGAWPRLG